MEFRRVPCRSVRADRRGSAPGNRDRSALAVCWFPLCLDACRLLLSSRRARPCARVQIAPGGEETPDIGLLALRAETDTYGAAGDRIVVTHGGQDMAPPHLAGRTGRAGADRDAREIERHDLGFGLDSGHGKAARIADARRLRSRNRDVRDLSARAAFQHVAELRDSIRAGQFFPHQPCGGTEAGDGGDDFRAGPPAATLPAPPDAARARDPLTDAQRPAAPRTTHLRGARM